MMALFQLKFIVPVLVIFMTLLDPMTSFSPHKWTIHRTSTSAGNRRHQHFLWLGESVAAAGPPLMVSRKKATNGGDRSLLILFETPAPEGSNNDDNGHEIATTTTTTTTTQQSLQEKMKKWQASEEEIKAASLGGVVPKKQQQQQDGGRSDSFDVGLYVAFPFMIVACLLFLAFPFFADHIDVSSVGPPPMT
jgi:hypothetical protein